MFIVLFRNRKRADLDDRAYAADAERMAQLAASQPGYRAFKSYAAHDGEVIAVSEWDSEAAARGWVEHPDHRTVQQRGRTEYYESYTLFACGDPRIHQFDRS